MNAHRASRLCVLFSVAGWVLAFAAPPSSAQQPGRPARHVDPDSDHFQARFQVLQQTPSSEAFVFVDATSGIDTTNCGSSAQPCRTISQGLQRAREIRSGAHAGSVERVTIEIRPGTYAESITVKLNGVRLRGAGTSLSSIVSPAGIAVLVSSALPVEFEGLTLVSQDSSALHVVNNSAVAVRNCQFRDSRRGAGIFTGSVAQISSSTFSNNRVGIAASDDFSLILEGLVITGVSRAQGSGLNVGDGVVGIHNSTISQTGTGIRSFQAGVYTLGGLTVANNGVGILTAAHSDLELLGETTITGNGTGVFVDDESFAILFGATVENNGTGIHVEGNSYLRLEESIVRLNTTGVFFDLFAKGVFRQADVGNNGTDTATNRGGAFFTEP